MQIRGAIDGFTGQPIDIPELGGVGVAVQNVIHPETRVPVRRKSQAQVRVPLPITRALDLVVRRERLPAEVAVFQTAAPGARVLDIKVFGSRIRST